MIEKRKIKGIEDTEGKTAIPITSGDKYERGRKTLERLTEQPQQKPATGKRLRSLPITPDKFI